MIRINNDEIEPMIRYNGLAISRELDYPSRGIESLIFKDLRYFYINKDVIHVTAHDKWGTIKRTISLYKVQNICVWDYEDKQIEIYFQGEEHPERLTIWPDRSCYNCKHTKSTIYRLENKMLKVFKAEPCIHCIDYNCFEKK